MMSSAHFCLMQHWKFRFGIGRGVFSYHGLALDNAERLTNIRYADALVLYSKSWQELCDMLEILTDELAAICVSLNTSKTKILTTVTLEAPMYIDVADGMVEVLFGDAVHRYLGRHISGDLTQRSTSELSRRIASAWGKFHKHRTTLMNRNVSVKLRLKMFHAVVSPTMLFGLTTLPLTTRQKQQLDAVQRRMLRSIAGWARPVDGDWATAMRQTNNRVNIALKQFPIENWTVQLARRQLKLALKFADNDQAWAAKAIRWHPCTIDVHRHLDAYRGQGPPRRKWDDDLATSSRQNCPQYDKWIDAATAQHDWLAKMQDFNDCVQS